MNFLQLAKDQRYSVRMFKDQAVEKEKLNLILEAGRIAPTAANFQPQRILVIEDATAHEKLKRFDIDYSVFYNSFDGITEGEAH